MNWQFIDPGKEKENKGISLAIIMYTE